MWKINFKVDMYSVYSGSYRIPLSDDSLVCTPDADMTGFPQKLDVHKSWAGYEQTTKTGCVLLIVGQFGGGKKILLYFSLDIPTPWCCCYEFAATLEFAVTIQEPAYQKGKYW
jgi:hypothetical protein